MKKLFLVALAAVGLASCVQTEELAVANNNQAIGFDTFVDNVTKTLYDNNNLDHFNVYGTITADNGGVITNIFPGVEVSNATGVWAYGSQYTQYWIPGFTYNFAAVVDGAVEVDATTGMPATISTDMTAQNDVLYATEGRHFGTNDTAAKVSFQFAHLLSKAKFTVKNGIVNGQGFVYNVESVKITNAYDTAVYNVADGAWTGTGDYDADFGVKAAVAQDANTVSKDILLVPGTKELAIEIVYSLKYNGATLKQETKELTAVLTLAKGNAYNFVVEFGAPGEDIKFDAQVKDWTEGGNVTPGTSYVATAEEFTTAIAADGIDRIVLADDIVLTTGATRAAGPSFVLNNGKELTIDLGEKTLTANFTPADESAAVFDVRGTLNVENGTVIMNREDAAFSPNYRTCVFCTSSDGVVNLNGVTAKNNGGAGMAYVLDMSNATNAAYNVENSTLESTYIAVRIFNNNKNGVHNATIKNSTLKGKYCFWVQYYLADGRTQEELDRQLQLDIYNNENTFEPAEGKLPILFGYNSFVSANGDGITKSVSEDGTVVTLGTLVENGVVGRGAAGAEENSTIKQVVVGEGITTLYDRTFRRFYALEEVILPNGLTTIGAAGSGVFQSCKVLKNVVIPETVTVLGEGTFQECTSLESINIPAGVTRIEKNVFRNTGLTSVEFHAGVTYFGAQAFRDCKQLKEVIINAPQFTVEANAFGVMSGALPGTTIYVANAEMKANLESTLAYANQFTVVAPSVASTTEQLTEALTNGETRVHLAAGTYTMPASSKFSAETVLTCEEGVVFEGQSGLNINGATIIGATFKNEGGVAVSGTINGTLKNCTFEGKEALRWCYSEAGKTVVFENCVINNDFRGFHFDDMNGDVLFKNCHINGFNAYGGEGTATFEGCTFGTDDRSRYNGLNIYANTVLTDCTFIYKSGKTNFIDLEAAGKTLTITNCTATLDGAAVNVVDYVGGSKLPECTVTIDGELYIAPVTTAEALKKAINAGKQTIYVKGQIDLTEEILANYNGTIIGADDTACLNTRTFVVKAADEAFHLSDKTINFKNITIKVPAEDGDFLKTGFVAAGTMNFDHCVLEGQVTLNGSATWTFDDCEFGGADSGAYASFVYGAKKVNFNRCSFSGVDRAAKVYGTGGVLDVEYNNCTFTSTTSNKYAVNIDASYATTKVALNGCSQTGMPGLYLVTGAKATVFVDEVQQ